MRRGSGRPAGRPSPSSGEIMTGRTHRLIYQGDHQMLTNLQEQEIDLHVRLKLSKLNELKEEADRLHKIKVEIRNARELLENQYQVWLREQSLVEPSEQQNREQQQWVINCATAYENYTYAQCMATGAFNVYENYRFQMFGDGPIPIKSDLVFKD